MRDTTSESRSENRSTLRWNFRMSAIDGMLANVAVGMVTPFLAVYAMTLGGSNDVVGLITAVPALVNTFMYLLAASIVERQSSLLRTATRYAILGRMFYFLMALVPFFPLVEYRAALLVLAIGLQTIPTVITTVSWTALMGDTFPQDERSRLFAMRSMYCSFAALISSLLAGVLLDRVPYPTNYVALFMISFVTSMASVYYLSRMRERPRVVATPAKISVAQRMRRPFSDPCHGARFTVFTISALLVQLGISIAVPVYSIYYVRVLKLSNSVVGSLSLASGLTAVLAYPVWGLVARRAGNAVVYAISILYFAIFPVLYGLSGTPAYLIVNQLVIGIFNAGHAFTLFNLLLEYVDPEESANGVAVFNTMLNATGIIGPFIATAVVSRTNVMTAFIVSSVVRMAGYVVFMKVVGTKETFGSLRSAFAPSVLRRRRLSRKARGGF